MRAAVSRLRHTPGVAYVAPNFLAHVSASGGGQWIPDDPGFSGQAEGWEAVQWNFLAGSGVDAPGAWANLRADHRPGAAE